MQKKIRVALLFGGRSAEHEVSLQSAKNIYDAIDKQKYEVILIGIDRQGQWHLNSTERFLINAENPEDIRLDRGEGQLAMVPGNATGQLFNVTGAIPGGTVDVVFPVLHGPYGEDGTVQGLLKLADIPFVGSDVLGSAVGMDKDVMKRLFEQAGLPQAGFFVAHTGERSNLNFKEISDKLKAPFFVKPANLGSSVGIHKIHDAGEFDAAVDDALKYDTKLVFEEYIAGREIECSVLGNDSPVASQPGEIISRHEFYDYNAKYIDQDGAHLQIPADLDKTITARVQELALEAFRVLCCSGMARVDFFLKEDGTVLINELNSIPGFTRISMYPKLWEFSGIAYADLIDRLIMLAIEKHQQTSHIRSQFNHF